MPTLYEILGVNPKAQPAEVRTAYRRLARAYHPDLNPDPKAHERMAQINEAFEVLSDPVRRMEYDASIGRVVFSEPSQAEEDVRVPGAVRYRIIQRLRAHRTPVYSAAYAPDTGRLVTSAFDNELIWWHDDAGIAEERLRLDGGVVSSITAMRGGRVIAAGSTEQSLACWSVDGLKATSWRQTPKDWIVCVKPSPDGESLALGAVNRVMRVCRVSDGQLRFSGSTHKDSVTALAWSEDSRFLATGSADATAKIWCGITGREIKTFKQVRSAVTSLAFSPDGNLLAVAAVDLSIRVFDARDGALKKTFFGHEKPIEAIAFHPRGWLLGSASRDGSVGLWNVVHGEGHGKIEASHQPLECVAFSPDGRRVIAGGLDKVLRVWSLSTPK